MGGGRQGLEEFLATSISIWEPSVCPHIPLFFFFSSSCQSIVLKHHINLLKSHFRHTGGGSPSLRPRRYRVQRPQCSHQLRHQVLHELPEATGHSHRHSGSATSGGEPRWLQLWRTSSRGPRCCRRRNHDSLESFRGPVLRLRLLLRLFVGRQCGCPLWGRRKCRCQRLNLRWVCNGGRRGWVSLQWELRMSTCWYLLLELIDARMWWMCSRYLCFCCGPYWWWWWWWWCSFEFGTCKKTTDLIILLSLFVVYVYTGFWMPTVGAGSLTWFHQLSPSPSSTGFDPVYLPSTNRSSSQRRRRRRRRSILIPFFQSLPLEFAFLISDSSISTCSFCPVDSFIPRSGQLEISRRWRRDLMVGEQGEVRNCASASFCAYSVISRSIDPSCFMCSMFKSVTSTLSLLRNRFDFGFPSGIDCAYVTNGIDDLKILRFVGHIIDR